MGRRVRSERNMLGLAGLGIEYAQHAKLLAGIPDLAVGRRRHVVRIGARRELIERDLRGLSSRCRERQRRDRRNQFPEHLLLLLGSLSSLVGWAKARTKSGGLSNCTAQRRAHADQRNSLTA